MPPWSQLQLRMVDILLLCLALCVLMLFFGGCTAMERGEPVTLKEVLELPTPPKPSTPPAVTPPPVLAPPAVHSGVSAGTVRAWIPRQQSVNGDVVEGHYLLISLTSPRQQTIEPAKVVPRTPNPHYTPTPPVPTLQVPVDQLPPGTLPHPPLSGSPPPAAGVMPPGFVLPGMGYGTQDLPGGGRP